MVNINYTLDGQTSSQTISNKSSLLYNKTLLHSRRTATRLTSSGDLESEYIKNLQQQIYFLELEVNYLREQVNTKKPPPSAIPGTQVEKWTQEIRVSNKSCLSAISWPV